MKKIRFVYPAIFVKSAEGDCQVIFPDLNIYTDGKNTSEAFINAKDLLQVYFSYAVKYEIEYNTPTKIEELLPKCKQNEVIMYVDAVVEFDS